MIKFDPNIEKYQFKGSLISTGDKLRPGAFLFAEVIKQIKPNLYLISIKNKEIKAQCNFPLKIGQNLEVKVEQDGTQIQLKLIPKGSFDNNANILLNNFLKVLIALGMPLEGKYEKILSGIKKLNIKNIKKAALFVLLKDKGFNLDQSEWKSFNDILDSDMFNKDKHSVFSIINNSKGERFETILLPIFDNEKEKGSIAFVRDKKTGNITISFNLKVKDKKIDFILSDKGSEKQLRIHSDINNINKKDLIELAQILTKFNINLEPKLYSYEESGGLIFRDYYLEDRIIG